MIYGREWSDFVNAVSIIGLYMEKNKFGYLPHTMH